MAPTRRQVGNRCDRACYENNINFTLTAKDDLIYAFFGVDDDDDDDQVDGDDDDDQRRNKTCNVEKRIFLLFSLFDSRNERTKK